MNPEPLVTVLMPVYNGEKYLEEAIQSILSQSFHDFELVAIDDGSTDRTSTMLEDYACRDGRVKVFTQENRGLVPTLNRGLELARGKYLARMDADDISNPERLEKQLEFMERNKDVVLLGALIRTMDENGSLLWTEHPPLHDTSIRWQLLFDNPFTHSMAMFRIKTVKDHSLVYRKEAVLAEDYDLWSRLMDFGRGHNLDTPLLTRRFHDRQISENVQARGVSGKSATRIARSNLIKLGFDLTEETVDRLRIWSHHFPRILDVEDEKLCAVLVDVLEAFCRQPNLDQEQVRLVRGRTTLRLLMARSNKPGGQLWKIRVIGQLRSADLIWVAKYIRYRQRLLGKFPYKSKSSEKLGRR
jgi:glycosyltransferase involved in cell wall biosynthesis